MTTNINDILRSNKHCCIGFSYSCRRRSAGVQAFELWFGETPGNSGSFDLVKLPKSFDLVKLREKSRDVWAKYVITFAKSLKIWANSPKIQAKMAPNLFRLRNWCQITWRRFFGGNPKFGLHAMYKRWPKIFPWNLGNFGQKSFAPLKICVFHTNAIILTYVFPTQPAQHFSSYIPHGPQQKVLCSPVRSAEWPTVGQRPTVFRPPKYSVIGSITAFRNVEKCWVFFGQPWHKIRAGFSWSETLTLSSCEASLSHCFDEKVEKG